MSPSPPPDEKRPSDAPPADAPKPEGATAPKVPRMPPAGPHAAPHLTNPDATPGTGVLTSPDYEDSDGEADAGTG